MPSRSATGARAAGSSGYAGEVDTSLSAGLPSRRCTSRIVRLPSRAGYVFLRGPANILVRLGSYAGKVTDLAELFVPALIEALAVGILVVVQKTLNGFWKHDQPDLAVTTKFSRIEITWLAIGGIVWCLTLIGILIPSQSIQFNSKYAGNQRENGSQSKLQNLPIGAALDDAIAKFDLGVEYFRIKDYKRAAKMWEISANYGILEAYNNLGYLTYYGLGAKEDQAEGLRLWWIAAENGFSESQSHIAEAYTDGKYLKKDLIEAYGWAQKAKHFAPQIGNAELAEDLIKYAEKLMANLIIKLSKAKVIETDKKVASYISMIAANRRSMEYTLRYPQSMSGYDVTIPVDVIEAQIRNEETIIVSGPDGQKLQVKLASIAKDGSRLRLLEGGSQHGARR
jgi:hypothetical protein